MRELGRSVFVVPAESFKSRRDHVVILNDAAWSRSGPAVTRRTWIVRSKSLICAALTCTARKTKGLPLGNPLS